MTMRNNQVNAQLKNRFLANIDDDLNEISMIKDSTNMETTQI